MSVLVSLSCALSTETAMATGARLEPVSLPGFSLSGLWDRAHEDPVHTPEQQGGTARGKGHHATAGKTSHEGSAGRAPGRGKGELAPYQRQSDRPHTVTTGPAAGSGDGFDPRTSKRDARKSTATSDYYANDDGSATVRHYTGRANFKGTDGAWKPIDTTLEKDGSGRLEERANSLGVDFAPKASDHRLASVDFGSGKRLSYSLKGAAEAEPSVASDGTVTYPGVLADTDVQMVPLAEGFKENLVLRSPDAPNSWDFLLDAEELTPRITAAGDVEFTDAKGTVAATVPHAFMADSKIDPRSGDATASRAVDFTLVRSGGSTVLRMTADRAWLDAPERVYPVTVDPTITASNTTYVQNNYSADRSTENVIKVGSYDSGTNKANSFLQFSSLGTTLKGQRVTSAKLNVYASWSSTCTAEVFYVHPVSQSWSPTTTTTYPGPSYSTAIGSATVDPGSSCTNTSASTSVGVKMPVTLPTSWFDQIAVGATQYGLALTAPVNDGLHWKKFHSDNSSTSGFRPALELTYTPNTKPQVNAQYPPVNYRARTLQPELLVYASDADNWPGALSYSFEVYDADSGSNTPVASSGLTSSPTWRVPAGKLTWSKNYLWYVSVTDGYDAVLYSASRFSTAVPQPPVTSGLAQNANGHEFDPSDGNYTTADTDADVSVVGPSLRIDRAYNSLDPRIDNAFGAGWSTVADMRATEAKDSTGTVTSVVLTYPGGEQIAFGRNGDGTFVPPLGRYARLQAVTGGYKLTDKDFTAYSFTGTTGTTGSYAISGITDYAGRAETFAYDTSHRLTKVTNTTSNRSLTLAWSTPAGATAAHVSTVTTDPSVAGDATTAQTWTYGYTGDQLTGVCPPADPTACTTYTYATGNHHRTTVLDADPYAFWRLGEDTGATVATDAVSVNQGKYNALYHDVALGGSGLLAGSTLKTAGFNGSTSYVEMPSAPGATPSYTTISLWFKTTQAGGVLFYYGDQPMSAADPVASTHYNTPALFVGTDGKLRGCLATGNCGTTITSSATVTDGQWHQAALTGAGNTQTMYLDGVSQGTKSGEIKDWNTPYITLGAGVNTHGWPAMDPDDELGHYAGQLAEVAIYTAPLGAEQIGAQYQAATHSAGLLDGITTPGGKTRSSVVYGTADDTVLQATDGNGGTWKLHPATVTGSSQVYRSAVMGAAPHGYWRLGDTQGAAQAANEVHTGFGTYNTVTQGVTGPFGAGDETAAAFDGTSSYAEVPYGVWHDSTDRSVELWFKTAGPGVLMSDQSRAPDDPAGVGGSWSPVLYVGADHKLHGHWWDKSGSGGSTFGSTSTVTDNAWHHAVLSASGGQQTLYLDGKKQADYTGTPDDQTTTRTFIGAGFTKSWYSSPADISYFNGSIGEVAVYRTGLTEAEVGRHWSAYKASSGVAPVRTVTLTDPADKTLTYVYDAEMGNRLLASIDTEGQRTTYGYDTGGFLHTVTDANGNRRVTGHDVRGNTVSATTCQDTAADKCSTTYFTYYPDATTAFPPMDRRNDLVLTERDGRSSGPSDNTYLTTYTYDTNGNVLSVTTPPVAGHPQGRTTSTAYTTAGTPAAEGGTATAPAGLVSQVTTASGRKTSYSYYANGDLAGITDANGGAVAFGYDGLGRLTTRTETSDAVPAGMSTTRTYDKDDRVVTETGPQVTNRVTGAVHQARTTTGYDADGNIVSQTVADLSGGDAARTTSMTYDAHNQLASRTDPGGGTTSFAYDAYGNTVRETDPIGKVNTYAYDGEGRLLTRSLLNYAGDPNNPSSPTTLVQESRSYDPAGRLASLTDALGWTTEYTYTDDGRSATVVRKDPQSGKSFTLRDNTYDAAGNLIKQVTDNGQVTSAFTVDAADRTVSSVLDPAGFARTTTVSYDPDDNVVSESETDPASGEVSTKDTRYDKLGNVTGVTVHDGSTAPVARYALDETTGYSVGDSSGANNTGAHGTGMHWNTDHGGSAVFDGDAQSYAQTDGPVVNTSGSFTVSTWAKVTDTTASRGLVSQNGDNVYGFVLYYSTSLGWTFLRRVADSTSASYVSAASGTAAVSAGTWTHLVGVYDAEAAKIRLYVNGTLVQEKPFTSTWEATGALQLGRWQIGTGYDGRLKGGLDDVQVYGEALTSSQVSSLYGGTLPAAGSSVRSTTWKLDQRGLPLSITDADGDVTDYGYDEAGRQTSVTEPTVQAEQEGGTPVSVRPVSMTGFNTFGEATEQADPLGNVTVRAYDADGQETSTTAPAYTAPGSATPITATSWNEYNKLGQVTAEVDPLGNRTSYTYTQLGTIASVTEPSGATTTYGYTDNGKQLSVTRPGGARQEMTWDYLGNQVTSTSVERVPTQQSYTTSYEYDAPGGRLSRSVSPTGVERTYAYDTLGQVTRSTDGAGNSSTYTYTMKGALLTSKGPDGTSTENTYDGFGNPVSTRDLDASGTVLRTAGSTYDRSGNPLTSTDYRGHTTTFGYDASGLVTQVVEPVSATESVTTTYGYDAAGHLTRFTDGRGNPFLTTYNAWGLPESEIEPSTPAHPDLADRTFTTVYDAAGRPTENRSPGGVTVSYAYDANSRLVRQSGTGAEAATEDHTYDYDAADRVTAVAGAGTEKDTFTYDDRGLLLSTAGPSGTSSFAYNGDGAMTSRTDASGTSAYGYDTAGRLKTVADGATGTSMSYGYDVNSNVTSIDYGTGKAKRTFAYDALQRLTDDRLTSPTGQELADIGYGWDANGNETSKTTTGVAGASANTYTYDWADRLASWNNGTTTEVYGYDASGNRTRVGGDTYTYDARNRLTSDGHSSYSYTARGTLRSVTDEGGQTTSTAADAFNRVISEGDRTYAYDGLDRVLGAEDGNGTELYGFQYSGTGNDVASDGVASYSRNVDGSLIGVKTPGAAVLAMTDLHTDVVAQFTADGEALTGSATYTPFGKVAQSTGMIGRLGYQSGWTDPGTDKVNMAARWYSPETGQFNSRDTVRTGSPGDSASANRYGYANDNPMATVDPTGHFGWGSIGSAISKGWHKTTKALSSARRTVTRTASSVYHSSVAAIKNQINHRLAQARAVKNALKAGALRLAHAAGRKLGTAVNRVKDLGHKVKNWSSQKYKQAKNRYNQVKNYGRRVATQVAKQVTARVSQAAKVVGNVADTVAKGLDKVGEGIQKAKKATADFVKENAATIVSVGVGFAVFAGCTVGSFGVGAVGCAVAAGIAANSVGYLMSDGPKSLGGFALAVGVGVATGLIGGALGGAVASSVGRVLSGAAGRILAGAAAGAADGALGGAVTYGTSCVNSEEGCSAGGAAKATAIGAAMGGVFGAVGSVRSPKAKPKPKPGGSRGGCRTQVPHSFIGATSVLMAAGVTKLISQVKAGDYILTAEPGKKDKEKHRVAAVIVTKTDRDYVDVTVATPAGPKTIHTTEHHQFYEATRNAWTQAGDLKTGQKLQNDDGGTSTIVGVKAYTAQHVTYDLTIEGLHTYYVLAGETPVLVHNSNGCPTGRLSDPLPRGMNNKIASAYDDVRAGRIPSHDTYGGREHPWWAGSKEYRVPGRPETDRILEKELPNGVKVYGWTSTHYTKIQRFSAPHFPDSGWN
ncbi:LamG-like jellyroll fold domain-containing protein [Streptomyces sp. MUM 2J]|uniref:LamG-like jellyroll fold domain-containing protein n=1 Tax=Streptomyces sp. MUM 2J TaxID=2791987 RepID=UPI001F0483D3|nr:LamG-like jellyroll fold domain-containing protein [Streptomyces sp. MUM 2J]